ncbi:MAG TPA: hypothetical protein VK154_06285 [Chitinophagales bacterium]|nr:hypothetical protein [Chitinophagales bacterium]
MKKFLPFLFLLATSYLLKGQDLCFEQQCFSATVNGTPFVFREYWPISASLIRQQGSMDGRAPQRNIISIFLTGLSYTDINGKQFDEAIQFEIEYEDIKQGEPKVYTVSLHYKSGLYSVLRQQGSLIITDLRPEPGKQAFRISAEFNCAMHSWASPYESREDAMLQGKLTNVLVNVPGWLVSKIQAAQSVVDN